MVGLADLNTKEKIIRHICSNARALFSFVHWTVKIKPILEDLAGPEPEKSLAKYDVAHLNESCLFHSAMMVRKFDDFFRQLESSKSDDVTSKLFDYPAVNVINKISRQKINKCLAHFTKSYVTEVNADISDIGAELINVGIELRNFFIFLLESEEYSAPVVALEIRRSLTNLEWALDQYSGPQSY